MNLILPEKHSFLDEIRVAAELVSDIRQLGKVLTPKQQKTVQARRIKRIEDVKKRNPKKKIQPKPITEKQKAAMKKKLHAPGTSLRNVGSIRV